MGSGVVAAGRVDRYDVRAYAPDIVARSSGPQRELTTFVGRRRELREAKDALSAAPLLTLIGPAGVGKTRLALRASSGVRRAFADGVWVAELADLRDRALLAETVASALGLRDVSTRWLVSTLADFLETRHLLLVLDNCEHLLDACAVLADTLLRACPDLKILATSRVPLGVGGETVLEVSPLPLPDDDRVSSPKALVQYDAIRLFVERARTAWPQFEVTPSNAADVSALCRHLDGLPLALELAAGRLRAFTVGQILEQIDRRFRLLATGSRVGSARHQSLKAAIDWSFGLLSTEEQIVWRRLALFAGSFDLAGADAVCPLTGGPEGTVADVVASLVDKSILRRELHGSTARYRMLETIREYGRQQLRESDEESSVTNAYRGWYATLAAGVFEHSWGPDQVDWWDRAHLELANLREAFRSWLADADQADAGLEAAANLMHYWLTRGSMSEGRRWLDALLEVAQRPTKGRAKGLGVDGWLTQLQGDIPRGLDLFVESERLAADLGDEATLCLASTALGGGLLWEGDLDRAEGLFDRCLDLQQGLPDRRWAANALGSLGGVWSLRGDHARASDLFARAIDLSRAGGDRYFQSWMLQGQALEALSMADPAGAGRIWTQAFRLSHAVDNKVGMGLAVEGLAWVAGSTHRPERAARLLGGVQTLWHSIPANLQPHLVGHHDACLADVRLALGDQVFDRAYRAGREMSDDQLASIALEEREPAVPQPASRDHPAELTRRESEIAGLVAQGLSNKGIASKLVISQRTAETHVEHILMKLGFTSRAQIAAWVVGEEASTTSGSSG
jgi:predicted ATPase/DNA-binding CsgD family transcriptional regulator